MTVTRFTYSGNPAVSTRDAVRFIVGDTVSATAELDDREIDWALTEKTDKNQAAATLLDVLAARYSRKADVSVGEVSKAMGSRAQELRNRAQELRAEAGKLCLPFFGGVSVTAKATIAEDSDATPPHFEIGQFDDPQAQQFDADAEK